MELEEEQTVLINQLKDLIRKKDEEVVEKNKVLKETDAKLSRARLQMKAKDVKISALMKKKDMKESVETSNSISHGNTEQSNRAKMMVQQKRIEEKEEQIIKQHKALKDQEDKMTRMELEFHEKHTELTQRLKEVSSNRGIDVDAKQPESKHVEELYGAIMSKDQRISELTAKLDEREMQLRERDRRLKEIEVTLQEKFSNEAHQRLLLEKLSTKLAEQEDHVSIATKQSEDKIINLTNEIEHYKGKVAHLERRLHVKEETVDVKEEQLLQMKREHDTNILDNQEVAQEHDQLIRSLKRKLHEQDEVLSGKDKVVQLLQDELHDKNQDHEELQKTINILQQNLRETVEGRQLMMEEVKNLQANQVGVEPHIMQLTQALQQYELALKQTNDNNVAISEENKTLKERLQSLEEESSKLNESVKFNENELETTTVRLNETIAALRDEISKMQIMKEENAHAVEVRMQTVLDQLDAQTKVLEDQTDELHEYKNKLRLLQCSGDVEVKELIDAKEQIKSLEDSLLTSKQHESDLRGKLEEMRTQHHDLQVLSDDLQKKMKEKHLAYVEDLKLKVEVTLKQLDEVTETLEERDSENQKMRKNLLEFSDEREDLQRSLEKSENLQIQLRDDITTLEEANHSLLRKVDDKNEVLSVLEKKVEEFSLKMENLQGMLVESEEQTQKLNVDLEQAIHEISKLKSLIEERRVSHDEEILKLNSLKEEALKEQGEKNDEIEETRRESSKRIDDIMEKKNDLIKRNSELESELNNQIMTSQSEIQKLQNDIQSRHLDIEKLHKDIASSNNAVDRLSNDLDSTKLDLKEEQDKVAIMAREMEVTTETVNNLAKQLKEFTAENSSLQNELLQVKDLLSDGSKDANERVELYENKLLEERKKMKEMEEKLADAKEDIKVLEEKFFANKEALIISETALTTSKEEHAVAMEECEALRKKAEDMEEMWRSEEEKSFNFKHELEEMRSLHSVSTEENINLTDNINSLTSEVTNLKTVITNLQGDLEESRRQIEAASNNEESSTLKISELEAEVKQKVELLQVVTEQLSNANEALLVECAGREKSEIELNEMKTQLRSECESLEILQSQIIGFQKEITNVNQQNNKVVQDFSTKEEVLKEQINDLEEKLNSAQNEKQKLISDSKQSVEELRQQLNGLQSMLNDKSLELNSLNLELETLRKFTEEENKKTLSLKDELFDRSNQYQSNLQELETLEEKFRKSEEIRANLNEKSVKLEEIFIQTKSELSDAENREGNLVYEIEKLSRTTQELCDKLELAEKKLTDGEGRKKKEEDEFTEDAKKMEEIKLLQDDVAEKDSILEKISTEYSKLQDELVASKKEYERWKEESLLMKERDDAVQRADDLQNTMTKFEKIILGELSRFAESANFTNNHVADDDGLHHTIMSYFEHNSKLEARLVETEDRLEEAEREKADVLNKSSSSLYHGGFVHDNLGELHPHSLEMRTDGRRRQGMEYLQLQLEELAHEQEVQAREHEKTTNKLNDNIRRLSEEKQQLLEAFEKQSESLNDVLKRYEEKDSEWNKLTKLVEEQQCNLVVAQASQESSNIDSARSNKDLQNLESHFNSLQEKYQGKMEEISIITEEKEKLEYDVPELKSKLKDLREENNSLIEQLKQSKSAITGMQQEIDHAVENTESNNALHQEEIERLKYMLRNKDEEITVLNGDIEDQNRELNTLNQSMAEKSYECEQLNESLTEHQNKVTYLTSELHERDAEFVAMSQHNDGAIEHAQVRAKDLAEYVATLEGRIRDRDEESKNLNFQLEELQQRLFETDRKFSDSNQKLKEFDEIHQNKLYEVEERYHHLLNEHEETKEKFASEVEHEKEKFEKLQEKYDSQVSEVSGLTSMLEGQIHEANHHHQEATSVLERKIEEIQKYLDDERLKVKQQGHELEHTAVEMEDLKSKLIVQEKWENEAREKNQLCEELKFSCSLLEERLTEALQRSRNAEEHLSKLTMELSNATERLEEREELVKRLGAEMTRMNEEVRSLKEALSAESERQLNELNCVVESRITERDEQVKVAGNRIRDLEEIINQKEVEIDQLQSERSKHESIVNATKSDIKSLETTLNEVREKMEEREEEMKKKEELWLLTSMQLERKVKELSEESDKSLLDSSKRDDELTRLVDQLNHSKEENELALKDQATKHEAQKEKAKKIVRALQIQMKHVKEGKEQIEDELKQLRGDIASKEKVVEESLQKRENDDEKMSSLVGQIQELQKELISSQRKCEESEVLSSSLKEQISAMMLTSQEDDHAKDEIIACMKTELASLVEEKNKENVTWKMKLEDAHEEKMQEIDELVKERLDLTNANINLNSNLNDTNKKMEENLASLSRSEKQIAQLMETVSSLEDQKVVLIEEKNEQSTKISSLCEEMDVLTSKFEDAEKQIALLEERCASFVSRIEELDESCKNKDLLLEEKNELVRIKTEEVEVALHRMEESSNNVINLQAKLDAGEEKVEDLERKIRENFEKSEEVAENLKREIVIKQNMVDEKDGRLLALQEELSSFQDVLEEREEEKEKMEQFMKVKDARSDEESKMLQESLRSTIQELNQALQDSNGEVDSLKRQSSSLYEELRDKDEILIKMRDEKIVVESLQERINKNDEDLMRFSSEQEDLVSKLSTREMELNSALTELKEITEERTHLLEERDAELSSLKDSLANTEAKLCESQNCEDDFNVKMKHSVSKADQLQQEIDELSSLVSCLKNDVDKLNSEKNNLLEIINQKEVATDDAAGEIRQLQTSINDFQEKISDLKEECIMLEEKQSSRNKENLSLMKEKEDLLNEISEIKEELDNGNTEIQNLNELLNEMTKIKCDFENKHEEHQLLVDELKKQINDLSSSNHDEMKEADQSRIKKLEDELVSTKQELSQSRVRLEEAQTENQRAFHQITCLEDRLDAERSSRTSLDDKCHCLEEEVASLSLARSQLDEKVQNFVEELSVKSSKLNSMDEEVESQKSEINCLRDDNANLSTKLKEIEEMPKMSGDSDERIVALEATITEKEMALVESQRKLKASLVSRKSLMAKVKELKSEKLEMETLNSSLRDEKLMIESRLSDSLNSSQMLEEERLQINCDVSRDEEDHLEKMKDLEDEILHFKNELETKKHELERGLKEFVALTDEVAELKQINSSLANDAEIQKQKNKEIPVLEERLSSLQSEYDDQLLLNTTQLEEFNKNILEMNKEKMKLQSSIENIQQIAESKSTEVTSLREDLIVSENSRIKSEEEVARLMSERQECEVKNEEIRIELEQVRADLSCNDKLKVVQGQLDVALSDLDKTKIEIGNLHRVNTDLDEMRKNEQVNHQRDLEASMNDLERLEIQLETTTRDFDAAKNDLEIKLSEFDQLQSDFDSKLNESSLLVADKEEIIKKLIEKNEEKIQENINLSENLHHLEISMDELQNQIQNQQDELETSHRNHINEVEDLNKENEKLQEKVKTCELNQSNKSIQHEELQQNAANNEKIIQLQRKLKAALMSRKELISETKKYSSEVEEKTSELERVKADLVGLLDSVTEKDKNIYNLEAESKQFEAELNDVKQRYEKLVDDLRGEHNRKTGLEEERSSLREKIHELETEVTTLQTCNKDMNEMVSAMETRTTKLEKNLSDRTESLRSAQKCIRKLETTIGQGETNLQDVVHVKKQVKEYEEKFEALTLKCNDLEAERREKVVMLEQVMGDFEKEVIAKEDLLVRCRGLEMMLHPHVEQTSSAPLEGLNNGFHNNDELLENLQSKHDQLTDEYKVLNEKFTKLQSDSRTSSNELQQERDELVSTNTELGRSCEEANRHVRDLQSKINNLESDLEKQQLLVTELQESQQMKVDENDHAMRPQVEVDALQMTSPEDKLMKSRQDLIDETLKQLKATQPENWEQEPGIKKLIVKLEELAEKSAVSKKDATEWRNKLEEQRKRTVGLEKELDDMKDKIERKVVAESKLLEEVKELHGLKEEMEGLRKKYDALQRDCDHLNSALQVEKESYEQIHKRLERENSLLKHKIQEHFKSESKLRNEIDEANQQVSHMKMNCSTLESNIADLQINLEIATSDVDDNKRKSSEVKVEHKNIVDAMQEKLQQHKEKIESLQIEQVAMREENHALKASHDETKINLDSLTERMTLEANDLQERLRETQKDAEDRVREYELNISNLETNLKIKDEELVEGFSKHQVIVTELEALKESLEEATHVIQEKDDEILVLNQSVEEKETEKMSLESKIAYDELQGASQTEVDMLNNEVSFLQSELKKRQSLVSDLVSDCMRLKNAVSGANSEIEKSKEETTSLFSQTQSLLALKAQYEANENHLKSELAEKDRLIHRQQEEVDEVRSKRHDLLQEFGVSDVPEIFSMLYAYVDEIKSLKTEIQGKDEKVEKLGIEVETLLVDKDEAKLENTELMNDAEALKKKIADLEHEATGLMQRCGSAEEGCSVMEEELEESRKRWEGEKTSFMMKLDEEEMKVKNATLAVEDYKQHVIQVENQSHDLFNQLQQRMGEMQHLQEVLAHHEALREKDDSKRVHEQLKKLEREFMNKNSVFEKIIQNSRPLVVEETYQQSVDDSPHLSTFNVIQGRLKQLEAALTTNPSNELESRLRFLEDQLQASDARSQSQTIQLQQVLADRDQIHSQMSAATNALQQYQSQYNNLHAEYVKLRDQSLLKQSETATVPSRADYEQMQDRLEDAVREKNDLSERFAQIEDELKREIERNDEMKAEWRDEVHSMWKSQQDPMTSITIDHTGEEEPILIKPTSFTRKVKRSRNLCSQWVRGKSQLRTHFRPFSLRAILAVYFIFLHAFTIKCAVGL